MELWWERIWPWIGGIAAVAAWWYWKMPFPQSPDTLFGTSATVASVFASFLGVAQAIIIGLKGSESYKVLQGAGYTDILFKYLQAGIFCSVIFACLSVIGFFVFSNSLPVNEKITVYYSGFWVFFAASSILTFTRISNILFKLLRQP